MMRMHLKSFATNEDEIEQDRRKQYSHALKASPMTSSATPASYASALSKLQSKDNGLLGATVMASMTG